MSRLGAVFPGIRWSPRGYYELLPAEGPEEGGPVGWEQEEPVGPKSPPVQVAQKMSISRPFASRRNEMFRNSKRISRCVGSAPTLDVPVAAPRVVLPGLAVSVHPQILPPVNGGEIGPVVPNSSEKLSENQAGAHQSVSLPKDEGVQGQR